MQAQLLGGDALVEHAGGRVRGQALVDPGLVEPVVADHHRPPLVGDLVGHDVQLGASAVIEHVPADEHEGRKLHAAVDGRLGDRQLRIRVGAIPIAERLECGDRFCQHATGRRLVTATQDTDADAVGSVPHQVLRVRGGDPGEIPHAKRQEPVGGRAGGVRGWRCRRGQTGRSDHQRCIRVQGDVEVGGVAFELAKAVVLGVLEAAEVRIRRRPVADTTGRRRRIRRPDRTAR